ncbi:NF038129 family PEP-CTERM protein [Derxia lacustris]|uniref:NF038129 family PEP-CTERM protein n=1 Tax=Derxia lacustris TaxID=764842 RepID=UPI000A177C5A|nr:NF038129 family PEP-CTERM protein [Derxia lacustris]
MTTLFLKRGLALAGLVAGLAAALPAQAATAFRFSFDTSSLAGSSGNLDFSFIGLADAPAATAAIGALSGGSSAGSALLDGDASATAGGWLLGNGGGFNAVWQPWSFGQTLSFVVSLDGDYGAAASGTTFAFRLWNADGSQTLLGGDNFGDLAHADLLPGGAVVTTLLTAAGGVSPVPEPDMAPLAGLGLALTGWAVRRQRRMAA